MAGKNSYYERTLPHWQPDGHTLFLTWRLSGSLPDEVISRLRASKTPEVGRRFRELDIELDRGGHGPRWMQESRVAEIVVQGIHAVVGRGLCHMRAWVVMPNHVHLPLEPLVPMGTVTQTIKGRTARQCNLILGRTGQYFWQDESFDHWIRNEQEFQKVKNYIERNPVSAGLAAKPQDWAWSSASKAGKHLEDQEAAGERRTD
jgi:REP element-mobilizing transposase RayT